MPLIVQPFEQAVSKRYSIADGLPDNRITRLLVHSSRIIAQSESGCAYLQDDLWISLEDTEGCMSTPSSCTSITDIPDSAPFNNFCCSLGAPDGSLWFAGANGAARYQNGRWSCFSAQRWLPDNQVNDICYFADAVWIATDAGVASIRLQPYKLEQKAKHYEEITVARHIRRGFVAECELSNPGVIASYRPVVTPNEGLWTSLYLASQAFHYAVTGDNQARDRARASLDALLSLLHITGIPGFMARSIVQDGEFSAGFDPKDPDWQYKNDKYPGLAWKDDTSSDEVDGHYLGWFVYYELIAGDEERELIREACAAVTDHILDNGYYLVGPNGRTSWGVWAPEKLNEDPEWIDERGLNALEILSHLKVAYHICKNERYNTAYLDLIHKHGYAINCINQKTLPPYSPDNHSDDELAWCAYYPLLMLEDDPELLRIYQLSLERSWSILRPQRTPFYNFLYGALSEKPCEAETGVAWLKECPLDLVDWTVKNSHRKDVKVAVERGRFGELQTNSVLTIAERPITKWNGNPYALDGGSGGAYELDGTFWLLPYWFGRYHRIISE